ncbi:MAG: hypothetical protein WD009_14145 [Phycisphaeraceae bacterium]
MFAEVHGQYAITLTTAWIGRPMEKSVHLRGPFQTPDAFQQGIRADAAVFSVDEIESWTDTASLPLLPSEPSLPIFIQLRKAPPVGLDARECWRVRPYRELDATNDKKYMDLESEECPRGCWPVFKGESFGHWTPDSGTYYGWTDPSVLVPHLQRKRRSGRTHRNSVYFEFFDQPSKWWDDSRTLPCYSARVAFRDGTNRLNERTVIAALVPPEVALGSQSPFLLMPHGDEKDEAYVLGVLSSIPLDWYARRFVERHLNFFLFNPLPVPRPGRDDPRWRRVVELAGRLACPDARFADWAAKVGVEHGPLTEDVKQDMLHELDAVVAHLYGLNQKQLTHIFETFHEGWDYKERLKATLEHYRRAKTQFRL